MLLGRYSLPNFSCRLWILHHDVFLIWNNRQRCIKRSLLDGPWLNNVVSVLYVLFSQAGHYSRSPLFDNLSSQGLQGITLNNQIHQVSMESQKRWQLLNIVVYQTKVIKPLEEVYKGDRQRSDLVVAEVKHFQVAKSRSAQHLHTSHFIHVQMKLTKFRHPRANFWYFAQLVPVQRQKCQSVEVVLPQIRYIGHKISQSILIKL